MSLRRWGKSAGDMGDAAKRVWIFRVATAPRHGGGHLSRCLTLADAMPEMVQTLFHIDPDSRSAEDLLSDRGYDFAVDHGGAVEPAAGLLLDGYDFGHETVDRYKNAGPMVVLDDLGDVPTDAALAVNAGFQMVGKSLCGRPALLGPRFALIGPEFKSRNQETGAVRTVLVPMGRTDDANATTLALQALLAARLEGFTPAITVALGSDCPHLDEIRASLAQFDGAAELILDTMAMADLLAEADLVVGAGGVGLQERVAMGVPSVTVAVSPNQEAAAAAAAAQGLTGLGEPLDRTNAEDIRDAVLTLAADTDARKTMSAKGPTAIDCEGPRRVADALMTLTGQGSGPVLH